MFLEFFVGDLSVSAVTVSFPRFCLEIVRFRRLNVSAPFNDFGVFCGFCSGCVLNLRADCRAYTVKIFNARFRCCYKIVFIIEQTAFVLRRIIGVVSFGNRHTVAVFGHDVRHAKAVLVARFIVSVFEVGKFRPCFEFPVSVVADFYRARVGVKKIISFAADFFVV